MYHEKNNYNRHSQDLKQRLLKEFAYPFDSSEKDRAIRTHTDLSGGGLVRGESERRKGIYNCKNREVKFYKYLEDGIQNGATAYINELAPTDVRTLFIDLDMVIAEDNDDGKIFLKSHTFVDMVGTVVLPVVDSFFKQTGWRENHPYLKFAVACPNQLRDKSNGKKFGAHIRAMQILDTYSTKRSIFLHVDNMLRMRRLLIYKLEELYPYSKYGVEWEDAVDKAPMKCGGMRMIGMNKFKVKCDCEVPAECEKCDWGTKHFFDPTKYEMVAVVDKDGLEDYDHLQRLKNDMKRMWMETAISSPFRTQQEANHCHAYTSGGVHYKGEIPEPSEVCLSQEDVEGMETYKTTDDHGAPVIQKVKKRKKRKQGKREKQLKRMKDKEELRDPKLKLDLKNYIQTNFTQYQGNINVSKVVRMEKGNALSTIMVYLAGANAGRCQNRVGGGCHQDNTYIQITAKKGAQQRCFSQNNTSAKCCNGPCLKFSSKPQTLPIDLKLYLFPTWQKRVTTNISTNTNKLSAFQQSFLNRMNRHMGYNNRKTFDNLVNTKKNKKNKV